jgi:purine nucleosidase
MSQQPTSIIIDADPGVDDFLAIAMAVGSPALDLLGITTVGGNSPLENTTLNTLKTLHALGANDVEVASGVNAALTRPFNFAPEFHGPSGLAMELPLPDRPLSSTDAVEWIAKKLNDSPAPITLLPIGPLTNIALLLQRHPDIASSIKEMVIMGGAVDGPGNRTSDAEFNTWNDPEAAQLVFESGIPITLVGLDVCNLVTLTRPDVSTSLTPSGKMMRAWFDTHPDRDVFQLCDPLAAAVAIDHSIVEIDITGVSVDCSDNPSRGNTYRDTHGPEVGVATHVDVVRARKVINDLVL